MATWRTDPIRGLDGLSVNTRDINDRGQVVGQSGTPSGDLHAFVWRDGVTTDLGTLGGPDSRALDVNEHGEVVGVSNTADGPDAYFVWRRGVMTRLPSPGPVDIVHANARINNRGQVAANYASDEPAPPFGIPPSRIFRWDDRRGLTDLGALGGHDVSLNDLNDLGQIVGSDYPPDADPSIFFWDDGVRTEIGEPVIPPSTGSVDLNNRGQVAFTGYSPAGPARAYVWQRGVRTGLGDLPGVRSSTAVAINERGDVTGDLVGPAGLRGYVWRRGAVTLLDVLGSDDNTQVRAMNDEGMVAGLSVNSGDITVPIHHVVWYTDRRGY